MAAMNYKLDPMVFVCGRRSAMLLFCVAGAGLWKYDGRVAVFFEERKGSAGEDFFR